MPPAYNLAETWHSVLWHLLIASTAYKKKIFKGTIVPLNPEAKEVKILRKKYVMANAKWFGIH